MRVLSILLFALLFGCAASRPAAHVETTNAAVSLLHRAREHTSRGRSLEAEQYLLAAWDAGALSDEVLPRLFEVCFRAGRLENLRVHLARARRLDPDNAELFYLEAEVFYALGDLPRALDSTTALVQVPTAPPRAWFLRGTLLVETGGDPQDAQRMFAEYLRRETVGPDARHAEAYVQVRHP